MVKHYISDVDEFTTRQHGQSDACFGKGVACIFNKRKFSPGSTFIAKLAVENIFGN